MWNGEGAFLRSVGAEVRGVGLEASFASALVRVNTESGGGFLVVLLGGDKYVASLVQEYLM